MAELFRDRIEAGNALAVKLHKFSGDTDLLVLGLPRGGVVVAYEVARRLNAPLDIFLVRKLGAPFEPELAMGAIAEGGILLLNDAVVKYMSISKKMIEDAAQEEMKELERRLDLYRNGRPSPQFFGKTVIVVDDGVATGATMKVALRAIRRKEPGKLVAAVPVGASSTCLELREDADEAICLYTPEPFMAVGSWYEHFEQTTDQEVKDLLQKTYKHPNT